MDEKLKPYPPYPGCEGVECPWWDLEAWDCCKVTGGHITQPLETKAEVRAALAKAKSQALGNLQEKAPASATNTHEGTEN